MSFFPKSVSFKKLYLETEGLKKAPEGTATDHFSFLSHVVSPNHIKRFDGNVINGPLFKYDNVQVFVNRLFLSRLTCH